MLHGSRQTVTVVTDPPGATVVAGKRSTTTPGILRLPRRRAADLRVTKPGCRPVDVHLRHRLYRGLWSYAGVGGVGVAMGLSGAEDGWGGLEDIAYGVAIGLTAAGGLAIDFITGAAWVFESDVVELELQCDGEEEPAATDAARG
jgi:hypothetical protein